MHSKAGLELRAFLSDPQILKVKTLRSGAHSRGPCALGALLPLRLPSELQP